jgi:pimeloyl-ACP methyl ester carboxylesterase
MEQTLSKRRRYLTADELEKLIKAARKGRYGRRDSILILLMARHGLRVTEAVDLRWDQIDFSKGHLHVRRLKGGIHSVHPIQGVAAWLAEKFRSWSDCNGNIESVFSRDHVLANIAFYWFTGAIGSSFWPYYARMHGPWPIPDDATVDVPTGYAEFPHEMLRPPRSLAARMYTDIRRWTVMPRGGHFAAMEQPDALAQEVREFFRPLRRAG